MNKYYNDLIEKINDNTANVCVIGLGYVGLNLSVEIARNGYHVKGIDIDSNKIDKIKKGISYVNNIKDEEILDLLNKKLLEVTNQYKIIKECDIIILALPTPLDENKNPNLKFLESALNESLKYFRKGQLLILESTTFPGTTENIIAPKIREKEFKIGEDFFLAYSPERIDLGNKDYPLKKIPKIIAGMTKYCTELAENFYKKIVEKTYIASSPRTAEFTKLFENVFRLVNIAYVQEAAKLCEKIGINIWEVIELAKTKPFGYMPFYPSAGAGGDCIPVNPYYMNWIAKKIGAELKLVETSININEEMYLHVMNKLEEILGKKKNKMIKESKILILGITYKRNISDTRNSPALKLIEELLKKGAEVDYLDPFVPQIEIKGKLFRSIELNQENIKRYDLIVLMTDHSNIDYNLIIKEADLIFDTRNIFKDMQKVIKLGVGDDLYM